MPRMVRKQVYLDRDQDRKLKCLARQRKVTEAQLIREAVDQLPEAEDSFIAELRAAGLLAPKPPLPPRLQGKDLRAEQKRLREKLGDLGGISLSDAVLWEREHSPY